MWIENKHTHCWWGSKLEQNFGIDLIMLAQLKSVYTLKYELLRDEANTFLKVMQYTKNTMSDILKRQRKKLQI